MVNPVIENLEDIAKVIASCDIIIGIDSAMIHLAGAMNKQGLVLLSCHWDYRWGLNETGTSPLYPTISMTRQEKMGDWTVPIISAKEYIENFIRTRN
jgi:ADP-heptose:LPS heptosyltransferase